MAGTLVLDTLQNGAGTASTSADNVIRGCAKAWVNFVGSSGSINNSYNVSSVTVNSTGNWSVNFTSALSTSNYSAVASANFAGTSNTAFLEVGNGSAGFSTTALALRSNNGGGGGLAFPQVCAAVFI